MKIIQNILKSVIVSFIATTFISCGPQAFLMDADVSVPSASGYDLTGRTIAVAYVQGKHPGDTVFNNAVAEGFATKLENEYFGAKRAIDLYKLQYKPDVKYSSKKSMVDIVMDTNDDIIFLFGAPEFGTVKITDKKINPNYKPEAKDSTYIFSCEVPFKMDLFVYDSMDSKDTVSVYYGTGVRKSIGYGGDNSTAEDVVNSFYNQASEDAVKYGVNAANSFLLRWETKNFIVMYYDSDSWYEASEYAVQCKWSEAMKIWLHLLDGENNAQKAASLEYNLSLASYMMGKYDLAAKWLDQSEKDYPIEYSKILRAEINKRLRK